MSNLFSTVYFIKSPTKAASIPIVVATQLMTFQYQKSGTNYTRTF